MAKSLHYADAGWINSTANTTEFRGMFGLSKKNSTEANVEMVMRTAGTISNLQMHVYDNTISGGTTNIKVRKNGADTSMAVAIGASAIGTFEDNTNTVSVAAGDKVCLTTIPGGATGTTGIDYFAHIFTPSLASDTVTKMAAIANPNNINAISFTSASKTDYFPINSWMQTPSVGVEAAMKTTQRYPGKFRNLAVRVRTNTRATDTIFRFRKNGANGNQTVTVPGGATGWFEDTTNEDTVEVNDEVNYSVTTGTGANTLALDSISTEYVNTSGYCQLVNTLQNTDSNNGDQVNINQNRNLALAGGLFMEASVPYADIAWKVVSGAEFQFSDIGATPFVNTVDTDSFIKLRVNNLDTAVSVTIPPNTTGSATNALDIHQVSLNDLVNLRLSTGSGSGSMGFGTASIYINDLTTTSVMSAECDVSDMATDGEFTVNFTTTDNIPRHTVWLALSA